MLTITDATTEHAAHDTAPLKIFVADDSAADRFWLEMVFKSARIDCTGTAVSDGEAARDYLREHSGDRPDLPDVVFLDQSMPCLSAMEVLKEFPNLKMLPYCILTGSVLEKDQWVNEFGLSPHCYILKPLTQAKLIEFLQAHSSLRALADALVQSLPLGSEEAGPVSLTNEPIRDLPATDVGTA
jgi:CheY-like chemotaxis protein